MNEETELMEQAREAKTPINKNAATNLDTEAATVPDAVKQEHTSGRLTKERLAAARSRGIEWVRASDLLSRGSSTTAGAGIRFNQEAALRTRRAIARGARAMSARARQLPPLSAYGRGITPDAAATRSGVGMR
ncbi:hypothetical protein U6G28_06535 [Actinomycetaceae bacterium MB13-C1-2]|nr:hypothetical protein U6G28_06535 [Actinomycetaceae bacterium MB13-C1-2]